MSDVRRPASVRRDSVPVPASRNATFGLKVRLLAVMGMLFFSTYGFANWLAAQRAYVPSFSFGWERHIPFWPWTIVPYWSIDLFYALSFFLWTQRDALLDHVKRILTVQCISIVCFIAWPLRFGFDRPPASGVAGTLFTLLMGFDKPFNQAPSLHIGLLVVLWVAYAMRARGVWLTVVNVWAALIGISVLTTWQHHLIDVPTGAAVGCFALFLFPLRGTERGREAEPQTRTHARRIARRYAVGAAAGLAITCIAIPAAPGWALLSGWIALALLCVAIVYARVDPTLFQKSERGDMPWTALVLFAPTIIGMFLNSRLWTFRHPAPSPIVDNLFVGRTPTPRDIRRAGITAVVDLTAEMPRWIEPGRSLDYVCVPQLDLVAPTPAQLRQAVAAIAAAHARGRRVLVCCALGYSRSALAVACWLSDREPHADAQIVLARLRAARPQVVLSAAAVALLDSHIAERRRDAAIAETERDRDA